MRTVFNRVTFTHMETTPGYNIRLSIEFRTDKAGRRFAQYWSPRAMRSIRVGVAAAETWIAQDLADRA